jgi:hypothetical protein
MVARFWVYPLAEWAFVCMLAFACCVAGGSAPLISKAEDRIVDVEAWVLKIKHTAKHRDNALEARFKKLQLKFQRRKNKYFANQKDFMTTAEIDKKIGPPPDSTVTWVVHKSQASAYHKMVEAADSVIAKMQGVGFRRRLLRAATMLPCPYVKVAGLPFGAASAENMGVYKQVAHKSSTGHAAYVQINVAKPAYLYQASAMWVVGPALGSPNAHMYTLSQADSVQSITPRAWMVAGKAAFHVYPEVSAECKFSDGSKLTSHNLHPGCHGEHLNSSLITLLGDTVRKYSGAKQEPFCSSGNAHISMYWPVYKQIDLHDTSFGLTFWVRACCFMLLMTNVLLRY